MNHKETIFPSFLCPSSSYFKAILESDSIIIFDEELYRKQSPRNHFEILSSQGRLMITFPVKKPWREKMIKEVYLDLDQKWIRNHWRTIQSAYGKAPFYHDYSFFFETLFTNPPDRLFDLNLEMLKICLKLLGIKKELILFSQIEDESTKIALIESQQSIMKDWDRIFTKHDDDLSYTQLFGNDFAKGLSIIDLLFNHGPESKLYLRN